jgi:glycosyltransferase involved in cell wall biosynthesis
MANLIFDAQVFQTPALSRGMGKYSFELIRAVSNENDISYQWDSIKVIVSSNFEVDASTWQQIKELSRVVICELDLHQNDILNPGVTSAYNRSIIDDFMTNEPVDSSYIILSLMQGEISPVYPTDRSFKRAVVFYDLIPLMFHKIYVQNPITRKEYMSKLSELFLSDTYFAISKTVANDLSTYLGVNPSRITNINGGPINHNTKTQKVEVKTPFILMPTGNDLRKNNFRAIQGFKIFNEKHNDKYSLVVTSFFKDEQIEELTKITDRVVFTGNVSGDKLNYLYENADLLLFPSEYEGLGLPVLEGLEHKLRIVCSDISVFREISVSDFTLFDPLKAQDIARALEEAVDLKFDPGRAKKILDKYTWKNSATIVQERLTESFESTAKGNLGLRVVASRLSTDRIGKLILQAHAELNRYIETSYYIDVDGTSQKEQRVDFTPYIARSDFLSVRNPIAASQNDKINLYHVANDENYASTAFIALAKSGILILHDLSLEELWKGLFKKGLVSKERIELEEKLNETIPEMKSLKWVTSILLNQHAVIVFSDKAKEDISKLLEAHASKTKVYKVYMPANKLVYTDFLLDEKKTVLKSSAVTELDDLQYENALSHASKLTESSNKTSTTDVLLEIEFKKYLDDRDLHTYKDFAQELLNIIGQIKEEVI